MPVGAGGEALGRIAAALVADDPALVDSFHQWREPPGPDPTDGGVTRVDRRTSCRRGCGPGRRSGQRGGPRPGSNASWDFWLNPAIRLSMPPCPAHGEACRARVPERRQLPAATAAPPWRRLAHSSHHRVERPPPRFTVNEVAQCDTVHHDRRRCSLVKSSTGGRGRCHLNSWCSRRGVGTGRWGDSVTNRLTPAPRPGPTGTR